MKSILLTILIIFILHVFERIMIYSFTPNEAAKALANQEFPKRYIITIAAYLGSWVVLIVQIFLFIIKL